MGTSMADIRFARDERDSAIYMPGADFNYECFSFSSIIHDFE